MPDVTPRDPKEMTAEQAAILETVFDYNEKAELSEDDLATLRTMFDVPEKFALLRRALQIFTPAERGILIPGAQAFVEASPADVTKYAFETAVSHSADEKVRQTLVALYRRIRQSNVDSKRADFVRQNEIAADEDKRSEEYKEQHEDEGRTVGERV